MTKMSSSIYYYESTEEEQKDYLKKIQEKIRKSNSSPYNNLIRTMNSIVDRKVIRYQTDFYIHDIPLIQNAEGSPLLWIVRDYGTHIVDLNHETFHEMGTDKQLWEARNYYNSILKNSGSRIKGIYLIENEEITNLSFKDAEAVLDKKEYLALRSLDDL